MTAFQRYARLLCRKAEVARIVGTPSGRGQRAKAHSAELTQLVCKADPSEFPRIEQEYGLTRYAIYSIRNRAKNGRH